MPHLDRRQLLGFGTAGLLAPGALAFPQRQRDLIKRENARPGTTSWQLTYTRVDPRTKCTRFGGGLGGRSTHLEGYASRGSVRPGERLDLFVCTDPPSSFVIDVYRLGYYQGKGGRHIVRLGPFKGKNQPTPATDDERLRECQWEPCTTLDVPRDWVSGVYLAKLSSLQHRYQSYIIFIVRDDRLADYLFQCSDNTWQAYNCWPDNYSLYINDRKDRLVLVSGVKVSFDRPYAKYCQIYDNPLSQGSGEFLLWEFPLAFWMEQLGLDVTYCSNSDIHNDLKCLTRCKAFLSVGHDEYWSRQQFDHVQAAVKAGVNAAFFSGNTCCFVTPFNGSGDWIVTRPDHWLFRGTGMKKGEGIPGLVGWEFHGEPAKIPGLEVVAEGTTVNGGEKEAHWTATLYPGPKGNLVFNASTIFWTQGLSSPPGHMPPISHHGRPHGPDARVQRITRNLLERFLG